MSPDALTRRQKAVLEALNNPQAMHDKVAAIVKERQRCIAALNKLEYVEHLYPSDANFLLVKFNNAGRVFKALRAEGIIVRDRRSAIPDCLRITIGTPTENEKLLVALNKLT